VLLPPLLDQLARVAPRINLGLRQVLPVQDESDFGRAWRGALVELEARAMDVAIIPISDVPARFARRVLYREDFVIAMHKEHALADSLTLDRYCEARHLVVSLAGDAHGFVDQVLSQHGLKRRVALTVPDFMFALEMVADTDLVCALPRRFAMRHAQRFGIVGVDAPLPLGTFQLTAVVPEAAMMDAGLAWLFELLASTASDAMRGA
jgi:DNA-binding transcriptional LysR family regulator